MIESPQEEIVFEPLPTEDPDSTINKDPEQQQAKAQFITSSFRRTIRHLRSVGGLRGIFRGFAIFVVNALLVQWSASLLSFVPFIPRSVWTVLCVTALAQFSLGWTHIVISEPSPKTWFRRLPSAKFWNKVALPTAILAAAEQVTVLIPLYLSVLVGITDRDGKAQRPATSHEAKVAAFGGFGILALALLLRFLVVIPAQVTLVRVQASLLPDSEETIVPFDRSFGGKVIPEIVGGSGAIGMLDAWKSFEWNSRIRLVKAYVKVFALQMGLSVLLFLTILCQLFLIVGKDLSKIIPPQDGDKNDEI